MTTTISTRPLARGVVAPTITVFDVDSRVDYGATATHVDWLVRQGVAGVVVGGSSGEFTAMTDEEACKLFSVVANVVDGRARVYAHTGRYSTAHTVDLSRRAALSHVDGLMVVAPYYMHPSVDEVADHFRAVRKAVGDTVPVILYNNPGTVGYDLDESTIVNLFDEGVVDGVKQSQGPATSVIALACMKNPPVVYYGHDYDALEAKYNGANGWLSGILNVFPQDAVKLWDQYNHSETDGQLWSKIHPLASYVWSKRAMHPVTAYKAALNLIAPHRVGWPRLPLRQPTVSQMRALARVMGVS